jgi:hypothetical protein
VVVADGPTSDSRRARRSQARSRCECEGPDRERPGRASSLLPVLQSPDSGLAVAGRQGEPGRWLRSLGAEFWVKDGRAEAG